jgi:hypothetical protein
MALVFSDHTRFLTEQSLEIADFIHSAWNSFDKDDFEVFYKENYLRMLPSIKHTTNECIILDSEYGVISSIFTPMGKIYIGGSSTQCGDDFARQAMIKILGPDSPLEVKMIYPKVVTERGETGPRWMVTKFRGNTLLPTGICADDVKGCINDPLYDDYETTMSNVPIIPFTIFRDLTEFLPRGEQLKDTENGRYFVGNYAMCLLKLFRRGVIRLCPEYHERAVRLFDEPTRDVQNVLSFMNELYMTIGDGVQQEYFNYGIRRIRGRYHDKWAFIVTEFLSAMFVGGFGM